MRGWIAVGIIVSSVILVDLGGPRLWDRDETRNAQCAVEMYQRGNYIVPTFGGELRAHKPVLLYWMQIASIKAFGINEWSMRFPSALCALGAVGLTMLITGRLLGNRCAMWTGLVLGTSILFVLSGRAATPDAALIFFSTLAVAIYVLASHRRTQDGAAEEAIVFHWPTRLQWFAVYAACALAVLAKGPVGMLLPGCVIGLHCMWQRRTVADALRPKLLPEEEADTWFIKLITGAIQMFRLAINTAWRMHPLLAVGALLIIASPWYIAVGMQTDGVWLHEFFWQHNVSRALTPMEGHSGPPLLYYLGIMLAGTFPWSMFAIPIALAARGAYRRHAQQRPAIVLAAAWILTYIGFFSFSATKLPSYITPCYPGVAILVGLFAVDITENYRRNRRWVTAGFAVGLAVGLILASALAGPLDDRLPGAAGASIAGIVLAIGSLMGAALLVRQHSQAAINTFAIGGVLSIGLLFATVPRIADTGRQDLSLWSELINSHQVDEVLVLGSIEPSWHFYSEHPISSAEVPLESTWLPRLASHLKGSQDNIAVLRKDRAEQLLNYININGGSKPPVQITASADGVLTRQRWVVLQQQPAGSTAVAQEAARRSY